MRWLACLLLACGTSTGPDPSDAGTDSAHVVEVAHAAPLPPDGPGETGNDPAYDQASLDAGRTITPRPCPVCR